MFPVMHSKTLLFLGFVSSLSLCAPSPHRRDSTNLITLKSRSSAEGVCFDAQVNIGSTVFELNADTGSSDLWVARTGFQCYNRTDITRLAPQEACMYDEIKKYDPTTSSTFVQIQNETFGAKYGVGIALGIVGTEEVAVGGITVDRQTIGVADRITVPSDGIASGILGLGHPILTSAHPGNTVANDTISLLTNKVIYQPLVYRMHAQGLIPSWFSLALERLPKGRTTGKGGVFGLGALPDVQTVGPFVTAPVEVTESLPTELSGGKITEWTLSVQGVAWRAGNSTGSFTHNTTRFQAVVDSGTFYNEFPQGIADSINAEFVPPATYDDALGNYIVDCDATPPSLSVTIANTTFSQSPDDMIFQLPNGTCLSSLTRASMGEGITFNFLGGVWLQNVVAVFDFGKEEMRFAQRAGNSAESNSSTTGTTIPPVSSGGQSKSPQIGATGALALLAWGIGSLILR
ncbi:acid protease [Xylaria venustula]|nr:acid protease [Xylaria venustula]